MQPRVLVVDDEKLIRWSLRQRLSQEGCEVLEAADGAAATQIIEDGAFELALLDLRLPDTTGIELMKKIQAGASGLPVILITAYSSIDSAVDAMKCGAFDYVTKPFNMDEIMVTVHRALEQSNLRLQLSSQLKQQRAQFGLENVIGKSASMMRIKGLARKVAHSQASTVLLLGESGVGKDLIAKVIHFESARAEKPFMNITCTALPDALLESELFGHEKGSSTDAKTRKKGLFELAEGGTVFLDEVGDTSPQVQAKLLRILDEKACKRVGGTQEIMVDVRVIAATNRDLNKAIEDKRFREDLFYRLNIISIYIEPLREHKEDIPLLLSHFLHHFRREFHRPHVELTSAAHDKLLNYDWPGNVRELRNTLERAVLLSNAGTITADDILLGRESVGPSDDRESLTMRLLKQGYKLAEIEKDIVRQALERTHYNQTRAAVLLGISRDQVRYKMEKFGIAPSNEVEQGN
jgi:two-component system response regulator AtoC